MSIQRCCQASALMQMKKSPSPYVRLFCLAKKGHYVPSHWMELLVSVYRKAATKRTIKELCLLFYALSKASKQETITSLRVTCRMENAVKATVTIGIYDVIDSYQCHLRSLIKYMNSKQLATVAQSLSILNRLDNLVCSSILNKMSCYRLHIMPRSLCSLVLVLSRSQLVSGDIIETLLLEKMDIIRQMNKQDMLVMFKATIISNIRNESILSLLYSKVKDCANTFSPSELLATLTWLSTIECKDMVLLDCLQHIMRSHIGKYDFSDLCCIAKTIVKLRPSYCVEFLSFLINPIIQEKINVYDIELIKDPLLRYYLTISQENCDITLGPIFSVTEWLRDPDHWTMFFTILQGYQTRSGSLSKCYTEVSATPTTSSSISLTTLDELEKCWRKGRTMFLDWFESDPNGFKCIGLITQIIVYCSRCTYTFIERLLKIVLNSHQCCPTDTLVDLAYNLHTIQGCDYQRLMVAILEREYDYKLENWLKVLGIQLAFDTKLIPNLIFRLRTWGSENTQKYQNQKKDWIMSDIVVTDSTPFQEKIPNITRYPATQEVLCYCLASVVLRQNGRSDRYNYRILSNDTHGKKHIMSEYRDEILQLIRSVKSDCRWLHRLLICMSSLDNSLFDEALNQHIPPIRLLPDPYSIQISDEFTAEGYNMKNALIQSGGISSVVPILNVKDEWFVFLDMASVSSRWDRIWLGLITLRFQQSGYRVVEFNCKLEEVLDDMGFLKSYH